jgi:hypothetical protein
MNYKKKKGSQEVKRFLWSLHIGTFWEFLLMTSSRRLKD